MQNARMFIFKRLVYSVRLCLFHGGVEDSEADLICRGALETLNRTVIHEIKFTDTLKNSGNAAEASKNLLLLTMLKIGSPALIRAVLK